VRVILSALLIGLLGLSVAVRGQSRAGEYRLKAAFVARFPEFVEWPPPAWQGRTTLDVCVLTPNPFGKDLPDIVEGQAVRGRTVVVHELQPGASLDICHVLFVTKESAGRARMLQRAATMPILTIGDEPGFLDDGGIIQLRTIDNRVRFEINPSAADRVGLRLSAQLLRLAVHVRGEP
jgi:hypothetical protein